MISSQASMHSAHWMHSSCEPSRMSMPVGQTATHACSRCSRRGPPRPGRSCAGRAARRASAIGDEQRIAVEHRALDARPGAHVGADLLAGDAAEHIGGGGEDAEEEIGDGRRRRRSTSSRASVGASAKVEDPGAAGGERDQQPGQMRQPPSARASRTTQGSLSRRMRALRSPCQKRSTAINRSVHTVCGQV